MKVIDLTMKIAPSMRVFPGSPQPSFVTWSKFEIHGYDSEAVFMSTHTGTHVDAPSHFSPNSPSIDRIPAGRFVCNNNAVLVKVPKKANQLIEPEDFADQGQQIGENDAVVLATGWERHAAAGRRNYMKENPGLSGEAAKYLVKKKVNVVCIDGPSIDAGSDARFTAHNILLPNNVLVVENLCNVSRLIATLLPGNKSNRKDEKRRFTLIISPLKLQGATGSPIRAIAIV